ncbi:MAG: methyltransferase domain-containing protein [Salibacteraceae bacterium]|nr:methyltransferase domain-containing protein [Salibacteraceae bacterium]
MLKLRSIEKEQLDNLQTSGTELTKTLEGLSIINRFLGNTNATFSAVKPILISSETSLTIIDLGCGGGDNLRKIARWCSQKNIRVRLIGIDGNLNILDYALDKNTSSLAVEYVQADILSNEFNLPYCDILISSHFVYHFTDSDLVQFLKKSKPRIKQHLIFSELERSHLAFSLFNAVSIFMPFTKMVRQDGKRAIERAFKKPELDSILIKAGFGNYRITRKWAFRLLISIDYTSLKSPKTF